MSYMHIELRLQGRKALVIGAEGEIPFKIDRLLRAGAHVTVISPRPFSEALLALREAHEGRLELVCREAKEQDAHGMAIVFLAPGRDELSRVMFLYGLRTGTPVCTLDRPEMSTFINPAVAAVSGLRIAVGTGGASPSLAKRIREDLEALFEDEVFARFVSKLSALRSQLPRGERAARMKEAVLGFRVEARLHFPKWFLRAME